MADELELLGEIEDQIIETLKTNLPYLKTVESYGGQLDEDLGEVVRGYPAMWVTFGGSGKPERTGASLWKIPATFVVFIAARSVRSEKAARRGSPVEIGTYQMLKDQRVLLRNNDFGLKILELKPGPVRTLYNTKLRGAGLSVFSQEWNTAFTDKLESDETDLQLLRLGIKYYIKPGDDVEDSTDLITLTQ